MKVVRFEEVEEKIINLRGEKVILDCDVASLYDVETKRVNEAVKNNIEKFPEGYTFILNANEGANLKSKISTSSWGGRRKAPTAFTERGLYMLATILKSPQAVQTTIAIIDAFAKLREFARTVAEMQEAEDDGHQKQLMKRGGDLISDILGDDLATTENETEIELNLALLKIRHRIKRKSE